MPRTLRSTSPRRKDQSLHYKRSRVPVLYGSSTCISQNTEIARKQRRVEKDGLADARGQTALALRAWGNAWHGTWPQSGEESAGALAQLEAAIAAHLERFRATAPEHTAGVRRELAHRLQAMFRRCALLPAVAFVYLALVALDLERLRAELVRRAAPGFGGPAP